MTKLTVENLHITDTLIGTLPVQTYNQILMVVLIGQVEELNHIKVAVS